MDDLSHLLNKCRAGCLSGKAVVNHIMYDDDLVQKQIHDACHNYPFFVINGNVIEESVKVKYLGHIICKDLTITKVQL